MAGQSQADSSGTEGPKDSLSYVSEARRIGISTVLILPLVAVYQIGIVQAGSTTRNIAEVWMTGPLAILGVPATTTVNVLALSALLYGLWESQQRGSLSLTLLAVMLLESALYAVLIYAGVSWAAVFLQDVTASYLGIGVVFSHQFMLSIGAAVYEELLFRLLLIGGGVLLMRRVFLWNPLACGIFLLVVSSLLFSAAHHVGNRAQPFTPFLFIFRTLCGAALGGIYLGRGIGIAVWTHALYNLLVLTQT